jgi:mRNA turnover protein 4
MDYARSGFVATETVTLPAGPLPYAHSMEPYLRNELGMPTALRNAVVNLEKEFTVCRQGEKLTPENARILVQVLIRYKTNSIVGIDGTQNV